MTTDHWENVRRLVERLRVEAADRRAAFLDEACGTNQELRADVESLLDSLKTASDVLRLSSPPGLPAPLLSSRVPPETLPTELMESPTASAHAPGPGLDADWSDASLQPGSDRAAELRPGTLLGNRYEVVRSLGKGGMGAVYLAHDREVDRAVALKVIRPELAGDPAILRRFRQELVLARQVTHPNVVRIFDLGILGGLRFISMEFVEGQQLSSLLDEQGKLPPKEAAGIILQVCRGLAAAHAQGVVHRDLKPANIMVDRDGRVVVMDFGIARAGTALATPASGTEPGVASADSLASMTQFGVLLGTPMYMSPEQARGESVDARSDLFTIGIILYELLTGTIPFLGKSLKDTLRKRSEELALGPSVLDPKIPKALNQIVLKCLKTKPEDRFQQAGDLIQALERFLGVVKPAARRWKFTAATLAGLLLGTTVFVISQKTRPDNAAPHQPLKILIADLENQTPDPVFNGALEPLLSFAMEDTSFITSYDRSRAHTIAAGLKPGLTRLDGSVARLVALREGVNVVISGSVSAPGGRFHVALEARDAAQGTLVKSSQITVKTKDEVVKSIAALTVPIRKALGDSASGSLNQAAAETFSSDSLQAAQKYAQAQEAQQKGNWEQAVQLYQATLQLDPNSGRAYSGLASTLKNLGRRQEAQKYYELALTKLDRMSEREKLRTRGGYFLFMGNDQQALEQNKELVAEFPADTAGLTNLAYSYFLQRNMATAVQFSRQAVAIYPSNVLLRSNAGLFAMYAGDFDGAIRESREILNINPRFGKALLCVALAQLGQSKPDEARITWQQLAAMDKDGASSAAIGLADLNLYQGRFSEAVNLLLQAIDVDVNDKNFSEAALKRIALAQAYLATGEKSKAVAAAQAALQDRTDEPVAFPAAEIFLNLGDEPRAQSVAAKLRASFDPQPRAYAALIEGLIKLRHKEYQDAVNTLQAAQKISDTWLGRLALARTYIEAGVFAEADSEADASIRRLGEATAVFFDDEPSLRYLPAAYYYRGRAREGLHMSSADADYRTFLAAKAQSQPDPLVTDARSRLAGR